ncbi:unnamed protein product, partial [Rotaria sordida]
MKTEDIKTVLINSNYDIALTSKELSDNVVSVPRTPTP